MESSLYLLRTKKKLVGRMGRCSGCQQDRNDRMASADAAGAGLDGGRITSPRLAGRSTVVEHHIGGHRPRAMPTNKQEMLAVRPEDLPRRLWPPPRMTPQDVRMGKGAPDATNRRENRWTPDAGGGMIRWFLSARGPVFIIVPASLTSLFWLRLSLSVWFFVTRPLSSLSC